MTELTTDLKLLHEATLNNLKNSKANNTLRAYKSDFKDFWDILCKSWFKIFTVRAENCLFIHHSSF